jgi:hypothetical protein
MEGDDLIVEGFDLDTNHFGWIGEAIYTSSGNIQTLFPVV